jgi:hypothetical protein
MNDTIQLLAESIEILTDFEVKTKNDGKSNQFAS